MIDKSTDANKKNEDIEGFECFACGKPMSQHIPAELKNAETPKDGWEEFYSKPVRVCLN